MDSESVDATFWEHIEALRQTVLQVIGIALVGCVLCFTFYDQLLPFLLLPLQSLEPPLSPVLLSPFEGFQTALKVAFWVGLTATSPLWLYVVLRFLYPALQTSERRLIAPFLLLSALFISLGVVFAFTVTIPLANSYLAHFNGNIGINLWSLGFYIDYTLMLLLANGLTFELSIVMLFLIHLKWLSIDWLRSKRRLVIVLIFVLSAIITPPDILTQLLLAIPLMLLYEATIIYAYLKQ